jgi:hypothetical protein
MSNDSEDGPKEGDTMIAQLEFGPPKFNTAFPERARRAINATEEHLDHETGEYIEKVVVQGELEVIDVYRKEL